MRLCVVGDTGDIATHCGSVLADLRASDWELISAQSASEIPEADLYIWEYAPNSLIAIPNAEMAVRTLFVLDPKNLDQFRNFVGAQRASIALKPASPVALEPFLDHAVGRGTKTAERPHSQQTGSTNEIDELFDGLLHANMRLQEYDRWRANLLARTAHDFRAPLTALSGYCGLLIDQRVGALQPSQIELVSRMRRSIQRLSRLSAALVDLSLGNAVKQELNLQEGDVEDAVNQVLHEIAPYAEGRQIRIAVHLFPPAETFLFAPDRIEQLLIHLLENSCKFSPKGGKVELAGYPVCWNSSTPRSSSPDAWTAADHRVASNAYRFDVRDTGNGIDSRHLDAIFEEYTSVDADAERSGGGLGLAIARAIVRAHEGSIWAESSRAGTQFSVILPYRRSTRRIRPGAGCQVPSSETLTA